MTLAKEFPDYNFTDAEEKKYNRVLVNTIIDTATKAMSELYTLQADLIDDDSIDLSDNNHPVVKNLTAFQKFFIATIIEQIINSLPKEPKEKL